MSLFPSTDEVAYGSRKLKFKDWLVAVGVGGVGLWLLMNDHTPRGVLAGLLGVLLGVVGSILMLINTRRNRPRLILTAAGVQYYSVSGPVREVRWDSLGTFEFEHNGKQQPQWIQSKITGANASENLLRHPGDSLVISHRLLDADPESLIDDLNRRRTFALHEEEA